MSQIAERRGQKAPALRRPSVGHDRRVIPVSPLAERAVVVADVLESQKFQSQRRLRRTNATLSDGDDFFLRCDPARRQLRQQLVCRFPSLQLVVGQVVDPFEVGRSRHMALALVAA